mmetsp:Transcript_38176/g.53000  ORF Transcript_38176/g.53000 Transcript_38176/m.53000 type:complete len:313 (+) Transcript_38176:180-1118(+)|eukprot:CAMPEP_0196570922 /NCGR_PEP_ID=MMETSP1081-20130531/1082_1 /TAXON_ID=36882 /ORGANISM="Pyramimonas amylifera, Strain CCMP720" /LENGTH=312 /DNA_ID=CAMNT_0041887621 /DNA_START=178 /DNA_END=1116 /DNA_ORIENTATION=-
MPKIPNSARRKHVAKDIPKASLKPSTSKGVKKEILKQIHSSRSNSKKIPKNIPLLSTNSTLKSVRVGEIEVKPGDNVVIRGGKNAPDFIGKVLKLVAHSQHKAMVHLTWYYRPEDTESGKKTFYGEKEIFNSDHKDEIQLSTINGKCQVHSLKDYQTLEEVRDDDYFFRFRYKASTGKFTPNRVPVYCSCEMPYNPDEFMVQCENCKEWYHPQCLGYADDDVARVEMFFCHQCKPNTEKNAPTPTPSVKPGPAACEKCRKMFVSESAREQCEGCSKWYHAKCMGYKKEEIQDAEVFFCSNCKGPKERKNKQT